MTDYREPGMDRPEQYDPRAIAPMVRRMFLRGLGAAGALLPLGIVPGGAARAAGIGGMLSGVLDSASDHALDRLAQPGAFYNDPAVRIGIPGIDRLGGSAGGGQGGGLLGGLMGAVGGVTGLDGITRHINDAAGMAAKVAKPVFHTAISRISINDVPDIATRNDGATQYLRRSAGPELHTQVRPLIDTAMTRIGAYQEFDRLSGHGGLLAVLGLTHDGLGDSVTTQALNGIYRYMGEEEGKLRANPLGSVGGLGSALGRLKL